MIRRIQVLGLCLAVLGVFPPFAADPSTAPDPHAGFDGIWNSATATPLERPAALTDKAFFTPDLRNLPQFVDDQADVRGNRPFVGRVVKQQRCRFCRNDNFFVTPFVQFDV